MCFQAINGSAPCYLSVFVRTPYQLIAYYSSVLLPVISERKMKNEKNEEKKERKKKKKGGDDFTVCNNVRGIMYKTNVITSVVRLIVHSNRLVVHSK